MKICREVKEVFLRHNPKNEFKILEMLLKKKLMGQTRKENISGLILKDGFEISLRLTLGKKLARSNAGSNKSISPLKSCN